FGHCMFQACLHSVKNAVREQDSWRKELSLDDQFIHECGYHTVDISPCSDGRLQGVLPFVLRMSPFNETVALKAYAGALFDIETDIADWTQRELSQRIDGQSGRRYLKVAIYHYSSSAPSSQGCAAHNSDEQAARDAAASKLNELRIGIDHAFGPAPGPDVLLIGLDTDLDAIRVHIPNSDGSPSSEVVVESSAIYKATLSLSAEQALSHIEKTLDEACLSIRSNISAGLKQLIVRLIEANLSQIEYVIQHHQGRYEDVGHGERFICVGDPIDALQTRNLYYFAHLDTLEEGAACVDVGIHIFEKLNITRGFPIPVMIHFAYASMIPGARQRAKERCERVMHAMIARYHSPSHGEALKFALCVTDTNARLEDGFEIVNTYCVSGDQAQGLVQ
ncbi:carboxysome shell carbonic anhydrase, partial [Acidihalobacter prosperus]